MKRSHSSGSGHEPDDCQSDLTCRSSIENNVRSETVDCKATDIAVVQPNQFQNVEIASPTDSMAEQPATVDGDATETHCADEAAKDLIMSPKNKFSNLNKPCENINMLLEAISSDDDIAMDFDEDGVLDSDIGENIDEYSDDTVKVFVPSLFQATPLRSIQDPSLSFSEYIHRKLGDDPKSEEVAELMDCLEYVQSKNMDVNEKWIITAERTVQILPKTLCHILNVPEYCHKLFSLVNVALDFKYASKVHVSMSTFIIRHLKIGLQLIEALCQYNEDLSEHLIKHHQIHNKLVSLFFVEHMSLSIKLNILRALDSSLNGSEPIRLFLYPGVFGDLNGYDTLIKILSTHQRPRVCFLITSILRKIHFYELLQKLNSDPKTLDSNPELLLHERLAEITTTYIKAPILMGCPKRFLQARAQFELTPALTHSDVYPTIYRLFDNLSLISCITKLLDTSQVLGTLEQQILKLLQSLLNCDHGLRYLGCRHKELNGLIKVLSKVNTQFKLTLIYKIKVLALIDYLNYFWECNLMHSFKLDQMESIDILHDVFLLTQSEVGKCAVVNVLTMGENLDAVLNFFKYMEQSRSKSDDLHILYSLDLMKIVLENSEDVNYLKKYGSSIYNLACKYNFNDLVAWTLPAIKHSTFFHDDVSDLCNIVKNNINNCLNFNKTLITSLRILKYLGVPNDETAFEGVEDFIELKYKYITLQMYSFDMLTNLLTIVDNICDSYKQPSLDVWKLTGNKAKSMISIIRPSMVLIRCMISLLIQSRSNAFKDLSPIKILLKLYNLMHHIPENSTIREDAIKVVHDISKTLKAYVDVSSGFMMVNKIIVWTLSSPSLFFSGLILLCKLLPTPLPMKTIKPFDDAVVTTMISFRNMWIEHLAKVNNNLVELIKVLGSSGLLLQPLKCLCIQISDLSISMCLLIARVLLDVWMNADDNSCFNKFLDLLTQLCDNTDCTIKTAVIQILNEEKSQDAYENLIFKICNNIKDKKDEKSILFVHCLCDSSFILNANYTQESLPRDSVLHSKFIQNILNAHISLFESCMQFSTLSLVIKTCLVIIQNDYGFYQFKTVLDTFSKPFYSVFNNLLQKWNKDDVYIVNTIMFTSKLLNLCVKNEINTNRVLFFNTLQLKEYLNWSNDDKDHPICLLKEITQEQNSLCYQHLIDLLELLAVDQGPTVELVEPPLAPIDLLASAFKDRLFYVVSNDNENYTNCTYDLCVNDFEDLRECNIEEIVLDLPDLNFKEEINDLFKVEDCITHPEPVVHKQEPVIVEKKENVTSLSVTSSTPTRHKVFSRLGTVQRSDTFRNRLPNTSRPPSLHVDDFVAMETRSARQPPRYKLPIQPIQDLNIRLRERQMAYERTYSLFSPYKSHLSLHNWHAQVNALAHLRADYHQKINSRHLELQRHSLVAEWRQLRVEAALRKKRAYSRR